MNIYNQTIPYFYIIRNKENGIMYAGSRWAQGCHPKEFMLNGNYQTSSPVIQSIVKKYGLDIFEILRIDTYCDELHPYDYETLFLQTNNCANSPEWYNKHNNNRPPPYGSKEYLELMLQKLGITNAMKSEKFKEKIKKTKLLRYGDKNYNNTEQTKQTNLKRYDVVNVFQLDSVKTKSKQTKIEKYGDKNYCNTKKIKQTNLERYGVDNFAKTEKGRKISKENGEKSRKNDIKICCIKCRKVIKNLGNWNQHLKTGECYPETKEIRNEISCICCKKAIIGIGNFNQHLRSKKCY